MDQSTLRREILVRPQLAGPLYFQIQQLVRGRIISKEWSDGEPLPNETELARSYGVSVGTMRKALDLLAQAKIIVRRQGLGTFVNSRRDEPLSKFRRWLSGTHAATETGHEVLEKGFALPKGDEARLLRIADNAPIARVTVRTSVAGAIRSLDHFVVPVAGTPGLDDFMTDTGRTFEDLLSQLEASIVRCEDRLSAEPASAEACRALDLPAATALLRIERLALAASERPLFLCSRQINASSKAAYQVVTE